VYANGFTGENFDFVPDLCEGVTVTLTAGANIWGSLDSLTDQEVILLKKCLGDADNDPTNNNQNKDVATQDALYNWDYGYVFGTGSGVVATQDILVNPHLVKLVDTSLNPQTRLCDNIGHQFTGVNNIPAYGYCANRSPPGFYMVLYYDAKTTKKFMYLSKPHKDYLPANTFKVYTTTGYLQLTSTTTDVFTTYVADPAVFTTPASVTAAVAIADLGSYYSNVVYTAAKTAAFTAAAISGPVTSTGLPNIDCETTTKDTAGRLACIQKGDYIMILDTKLDATTSNNPKYLNIYQVMKISRENRESTPEITRYQIVLDNGVNARYLKSNDAGTSNARIYKYTPPASPSRPDWAAQCSNRGICDTSTGICGCFPGYTGDDCSVLNALAV